MFLRVAWAAAMLVCVATAVAVACTQPEPTLTPSPTPVPTATTAPTPTLTPSPTSTATALLAPSPTPIPTPTLVPTPTSVPTSTPRPTPTPRPLPTNLRCDDTDDIEAITAHSKRNDEHPILEIHSIVEVLRAERMLRCQAVARVDRGVQKISYWYTGATDGGITIRWSLLGSLNTPPNITNPDDKSYYQGESISPFDITVTDAEDTPSVTLSSLPLGLVYGSGQISGTVSSGAAVGAYAVTISANDSSNPVVSFTFTISVTPNTPPVIANPGSKSYYQGESITAFGVMVTDAEDNPTVTVSGLPPGLVYESGQVSGTISSDATVGEYAATIYANDGLNPDVSATLTINVTNPTPAELVELVKDGVVRVTAGRKGGSGFIFDTDGTTAFAITNYHVVEDEYAIDIRVKNFQTYRATLLGYDSDKDVAVMSICCSSDFHALEWQPDTSYEVGDQVVAVGYPRSSSSGVTATIGAIKDDRDGAAFGYIAHGAPLNLGSSGGPLLSMEGKILGVNTAGSRITEGLFYAISYTAIAHKVAEWKSSLIITAETWPTSTPTCLSLAEAAYADSLGGYFTLIVDWNSTVGELINEASVNPLVLIDEDWKTNIALSMVLLTVSAQYTLDLNPPPSFRAISTLAEEAMRRYIAAWERLGYAIKNLDTESLSEAVGLYREATAYMGEIPQAIENHC